MANSVRDAMTENPRSIGASASVVEAARMMREEDIGSLPITDDGKLVGMITDRDITTRVVADAADPEATSVGDVSSRDPISVEADKEIEEALKLMATPSGSAAARCRERRARWHRCPSRRRPQGGRDEDG